MDTNKLLKAIEEQEEAVYEERRKLHSLQEDYLLEKGWVIEPVAVGGFLTLGWGFTYSKGNQVFIDIDHAFEYEEELNDK